MPKPKTNPIAVRIPADLEALIAAHMEETSRNRNLAIVQLLRLGIETHAGLPKFTVAAPCATPAPRAKSPPRIPKEAASSLMTRDAAPARLDTSMVPMQSRQRWHPMPKTGAKKGK